MARASQFAIATLSIVLLMGTQACGENPKRDGKSLATASDSSSGQTSSKSELEVRGGVDSVRITVQLKDGSKILGYPLLDTLTLQTQYAALRLGFSLLRVVDFQRTSGSATVSLETGERLQGKFAIESLPVRSLVGNLSVPINDIASITVASRISSLDSGLVAYYPFDGDARDKSGHGHDGTVNGAVLCDDRSGNPNSAYSFDGNESYIAIPDGMVRRNTPSFTLSLWLSPLDLDYRMVLYIGAAEGEASIQVKEGRIGLYVTLNGNQYVAQAPLHTNTWIHVVGVYRRGFSNQLWVDGKLVNEMNIPDANLLHGLPSHTSSIGSYAPAHFNHSQANGMGSWKGSIDDVRIYNRTLEPQEINTLFTLGQ